ncbi:hypothetical protein EWK21_20750 [Salmonella enterica subsp. enterica serovar Potsdam]|nr:hypothetical protein [Salmonella enterica subsp. enterica serovar Potsdam]EBV2340770.1 hypothetical protein [Salmonella enterica subsp. enterica serovar Potsdam]EBV2473287.1 hypothetical protein [Salmonella enterica subsp. enterica serovar Potsdam]ECG3169345.1 hypothetical protein [Salmonella enterica subsp. enterica serovar Potsdam]
MAPFSLLALYGHEQPDCQEGRFPPGDGDERAPAALVLFPRLLCLWPVRNHITFPVIILFFLLF